MKNRLSHEIDFARKKAAPVRRGQSDREEVRSVRARGDGADQSMLAASG